jgi:hypothetical protein
MKKENSTIILLVLAGLGIYWYFKNKKKQTILTPTGSAAPDTSNVPPVIDQYDYNIMFKINGMSNKLGKVPNTI